MYKSSSSIEEIREFSTPGLFRVAHTEEKKKESLLRNDLKKKRTIRTFTISMYAIYREEYRRYVIVAIFASCAAPGREPRARLFSIKILQDPDEILQLLLQQPTEGNKRRLLSFIHFATFYYPVCGKRECSGDD